MKQGKHYLSIVIWIFLAAIVAYFGYNLATRSRRSSASGRRARK